MPHLSDFFSDENRAKFAEEKIAIGSVIKCFVKNTNPPKLKRFVVLGFDSSGNMVGAVFINSDINWNVHRTIELAKLQHYVTKEENEYLDKDSYIDCSILFEIPKNDILKAITDNPANVLGDVTDDDLKFIYQNIKTSSKISVKQLKKFNLL